MLEIEKCLILRILLGMPYEYDKYTMYEGNDIKYFGASNK